MLKSLTITRKDIMSKVFAIHPGEMLLTEFLEPLGITPYRLAKEISVPFQRINEIVKGKRGISVDTAIRLGIFFGVNAQVWLNLQNEYDLRHAQAMERPEIRRYKAEPEAA